MKLKALCVFFIFLFSPFYPVFSEQSPKKYKVILDPSRRALLSSDVSSKVIEVSKKMGESFAKGDKLIQLDSSLYEADYNKSKALLNKAKADLKAQEELYRRKTASLSQLREAEAALEVAKAELTVSQKRKEGCQLIAPFTGRVVDIFINEFENIQSNQNLLEIVDSLVLVGKMLVPYPVVKNLNLGSSVEVYLSSEGKVKEGIVKRIGAVIDPASGLVKLDLEINNRDSSLKPGLIGDVTFIID